MVEETSEAPTAPDAIAAGLDGSAAAAILLMTLGDDEAAEILSHLDPLEVQHLGSAMFDVADVSEGQVENVFDLFMTRAKARTSIGFGAAPKIKAVMEHALGQERAETVLARITPPTRSRALEALRWMDARTIAAICEAEHPQIAALIMAHLEPPIAADVLQLMPNERQPDIIYRVARMESVTGEAIEELEEILVREVARMSSAPAPIRGGASEAAKIMTNTKGGTDQRIIRSLNKVDRVMAQAIEDEMFVFDDLMKLDDRNLTTFLQQVPADVLAPALKGADPAIRDKLFGAMSSRAADTIRDEIAERGPMRLADVIEAQKEMLTIARRLADAGTIQLARGGDDYV
jgi:flagellar motor switch protein FliG